MTKTLKQPRYPVIVARINNAPRPDRTEVRAVILRIFGELHAQQAGRFGQLRRAVLIARAALGISAR